MISFKQKGMVILLKNKRQIYVGESDFENFLIGQTPQAASNEAPQRPQ